MGPIRPLFGNVIAIGGMVWQITGICPSLRLVLFAAWSLFKVCVVLSFCNVAFAVPVVQPLCVGPTEIQQIKDEHRASMQWYIDHYGVSYLQRVYGSGDIDWLFEQAYPQLHQPEQDARVKRWPCTLYLKTSVVDPGIQTVGTPSMRPYLNYAPDTWGGCVGGQILPVRYYHRLNVTQWWNYALDQRGAHLVTNGWPFYYVIPSRYFVLGKWSLSSATVAYTDGSIHPGPFYGQHWKFTVCEGKPIIRQINGNDYIAIQTTGNEVDAGDEYYFVGGTAADNMCGTWSPDGVKNYWQHRRITSAGVGSCDDVLIEAFPMFTPNPRGFEKTVIPLVVPPIERHTVACPVVSFYVPLFAREYSFDQICTLFEPRKWIFEVVFLVVWTLGAFMIVLKA